MSNSPPFDNSSWKKVVDYLKKLPIDILISKICKHYVEFYLSPKDAFHLYNAYKASKFDKVKDILEATLKQIRIKIKNPENQKAKQPQLRLAEFTLQLAIQKVASKKVNSIKYTKKDDDLMELIHELSLIYDNTDQYLKGQVPQQKRELVLSDNSEGS